MAPAAPAGGQTAASAVEKAAARAAARGFGQWSGPAPGGVDLRPTASTVEKAMRFWPAAGSCRRAWICSWRRTCSLMRAYVFSRLRCLISDLFLPASKLQSTKTVEHSPLATKESGLQWLAED